MACFDNCATCFSLGGRLAVGVKKCAGMRGVAWRSRRGKIIAINGRSFQWGPTDSYRVLWGSLVVPWACTLIVVLCFPLAVECSDKCVKYDLLKIVRHILTTTNMTCRRAGRVPPLPAGRRTQAAVPRMLLFGPTTSCAVQIARPTSTSGN